MALLGLFGLLAPLGCDSGGGSHCEAGSAGCPCSPDDRCAEGLVCLSSLCVSEDDAEPPGHTDDAAVRDDGGATEPADAAAVADGSIDGGDASDAGDAASVACEELDAPEGGTVSVPSTEPGAVAAYGCDDGYNLSGNSTRTCRAGGSWSGSAPSCQIVDCGSLSNPGDGTVSTVGGTTYGQSATYACNVGYYMNGGAMRSCQASGAWSDTPPTCSDANTEGLRLIQLHLGTSEFVRIANRGGATATLSGVRLELRDGNGMIYTHDFASGTLATNASAKVGEGTADYAFNSNLAAARAGTVLLCAAAPCTAASVLDAVTFEGEAVAPALPAGVTVNAPLYGMADDNVEDFYRLAYVGAAPTFSSCDWTAAPQTPLFAESFECGTSRWTNGGGTFVIDATGSPDGSASHLQQTAGTMQPAQGLTYTFAQAVRPTHVEYWTQAASRTFMCGNTCSDVAATIYWDHVGNLCLVAAAATCLDTPDLSWSLVEIEDIDWVNGTADYYVNHTRVIDNAAFGTTYVSDTGLKQFVITGGAGRTDGVRMW